MSQQELSTTADKVGRRRPVAPAEAPRATGGVPLLRRARRSLRGRNPLIRETDPVCGHLYVDDTDPGATRYRIATPPRYGRATITDANEFRYVASRGAVRAAAAGGPRSDTFTLIGHHRDGTSTTLAVVVPVGAATNGLERCVAPSVNVVTTAVIPLRDGPREMVVSRDGQTVFTFSPESPRVVAVDAVSNQIGAVVTVTGPVTAVAVSPDGARLYAAVEASNCVDVVDTATGEVVDSLWIDAPTHLAVSSDGSRLLVATAGGEIEVIDTASIITLATLEDVGAVRALLPTPDDARLFVVTDAGSSNALCVVDAPLTHPVVTRTVSTNGIIADAVMSADGSRIMLLDSGVRRSAGTGPGDHIDPRDEASRGDTIVVIDTATSATVATIVLDGGHCALAVGSDHTTVHAVGTFDGCITVVDIDTTDVRMTTTRVGSLPRQAVIGTHDDTIFIADTDAVRVMSPTVSGTVLGGPRDGGVAHELIRRPSRGTVTVCEDGSFVYTADTPFVADDRFGVRIIDRYHRTAPVDVDVLVIGPATR